MYQPKHLAKWKMPRDYFGKEWSEYYVFMGHHRDSDNLHNSNFDCALEQLGGESETVIVVTENHWAVGWVQWIAIHESDYTALFQADDIKERLATYPVLDDEDFSEREWSDFTDNCQQAVKDWCNDYHKRYSKRLVRAVMDNSSDIGAETWPNESEIATAYAEIYHK